MAALARRRDKLPSSKETTSAAFTMDTYAHVMPGMQESAAEQLDQLILPEILGTESDVKMLSKRE